MFSTRIQVSQIFRCLFIDAASFYKDGMRILFVTSTRVGDAVLSTGLLGYLIGMHPEARVTIACGPAAAELFREVPGLERIIILEKMVCSLHWVGLWLSCAVCLWDLVVDLRNAPLTYLLPARRQFHAKRSRNTEHRLIHLSRILGLHDKPQPPMLWTSETDRVKAEQLIPDGLPVLAIGPTANWKAKMWSAEKFAELALDITGPNGVISGGRIALFGRDDERPQVMQLIEALPEDRCLDMIGKLNLLEIYACLQRCVLYVGNDSGLMHIAAASGVPTLGLFGPSREELYGPWGPNCASIRTPESFDSIHPEGFDHITSGSLMNGLTVKKVSKAIEDILARCVKATK